MSSVRAFLKKIQIKKALPLQILFVIIAFFLMVVSSYFYVNNIEYYKELEGLKFVISIPGTILAGLLILILIRDDRARNKSEEQIRRKSAEMEELREADERIQLMLEAMPFGCNLWNKDLKLIDCNQEAVNLFGLSGKKEFFERFFDLFPEYQPCGKLSSEMASAYLHNAFSEGQKRFEWMYRNLSGDQIPTETTLVRVRHRGDDHVVGYIRDLREYKKMMKDIEQSDLMLKMALKEAQDANMAKSKFLAAMSHEIRTPMNVILGVAESMVSEEKLPENIQKSFGKIFDSGNLLLNIINDILDLSKIEAGKFELNSVEYNILSLINDAANMSIVQYGHSQIKFKLEAAENLPLNLYGDELRIKQILYNLLSNAFKYTAAGEIIFSITAEDTDWNKNETRLVLSVSDTGQGMTSEQINKLFTEYARFNLEANRSTVGTGLGMTITRNLVNLMGGRITVDSTVGKGTVFTVCIIQGITSHGIMGSELAESLRQFRFTNIIRSKNAKIVREPMPYGKVLLVDDMQSNLDVAKLLLKPYELQIETVDSGFKALEIINNGGEFDIIFMDHMMPLMDGVETVKKIRELGYNNTIFVLTADAVAGQKEYFLANGFDGYISKPIDMRQLNDSLNRFIRDKYGITGKPVMDAATAGTDVKIFDIDIPGVDTGKGLRYYEDDLDVYISVLRSYVPNALDIMEKLANVSEKTLNDYAVNVHGLKGISAGIGAEKLREAAFALEKLSKAGNISAVLDGNGSLITAAKEIVSNVQAWLDKDENRRQKHMLPYPDRAALERIKKGCETYDIKIIDAAMEELSDADYEKDASLVTWLKEKIDDSDFSAVEKYLSEYIKGFD